MMNMMHTWVAVATREAAWAAGVRQIEWFRIIFSVDLGVKERNSE